MDAASKGVVDFLSVIRGAREDLGWFVNEMRGRAGIVHAKPFLVLSGSPFRVHRGPVTEEYECALSVGVSVKHANEHEVFWSVDVYWNAERWHVRPSIEIDRDGSTEVVQDLGVRAADTLQECIDGVRRATRDLLQHADAFDLLYQ